MHRVDRREARTALRLAEKWHAEGLLPDASWKHIEERYAAAADMQAREPLGATALYGLGGVLLGASVLALLFLLADQGTIDRPSSVAPWLFLVWGAVCAAAAFALDLRFKRQDLGDAFHVAALVAITAAAFPRADDLPLWALSFAYGASLLVYRRERAMVSLASVVAYNLAFAAFMFGFLERRLPDNDFAVWIFFAYAAAQLAAFGWASRVRSLSWLGAAQFAATLLLAGATFALYDEAIEEAYKVFPGAGELAVAVVMGAVLAAGLWLRAKGMVLGTALVLAIDAIVFAFDVGDLVGGLLVLLLLAGLLIWQAGSLRRYLRE